MRKKRSKYATKIAKPQRDKTLIEQHEWIKRGVIEGVEQGVDYGTLSKAVGVGNGTIKGWIERCEQTRDKFLQLHFTEEEIEGLSQIDIENKEEAQRVGDKYGEGVVSLIREEGFWLKLGFELKRAEGRAETRMLGVIRDSAIGHQQVIEERRKSVVIQQPDGSQQPINGEEVTTTTRQLKPQWQAAAWFLERKYPEKYAQKKIIQGELPPDIPYEVFMTAKTLMQLPKVELERIVAALREKSRAKVAAAPERQPPMLTDGKVEGQGEGGQVEGSKNG